MKVFICWSGPLSEKLGESLRNWIPNVIQSVEPYFTSSDVDKGARWLSEITKELSESKVGLLCLTQDNVNSDWLLFEAGALSKALSKTHVCPLLFGVKPTDLAGPLRQFQATKFEQNDFRLLMNIINERMDAGKLQMKTLDAVFQKWWPDLEREVEEILSEVPTSDEPIRSDRDLLEEILNHSRRREALSRRPIQAPNVVRLLEPYIALHNQQASGEGGYQDALDQLEKMRDPIRDIVGRHAQVSEEAREQFVIFKDLTYKANVKKDQEDDEFDEDIPILGHAGQIPNPRVDSLATVGHRACLCNVL